MSWLYRRLGIIYDWEDFVEDARVNKRRVNIDTNNHRDSNVFNVEAMTRRKRFVLMKGDYAVDSGDMITNTLVTYADSVARRLEREGLDVAINGIPFSRFDERKQHHRLATDM